MQRIKKTTAMLLSVVTLSSACVFSTSISAQASSTGAGLAEWALNAYYSGWDYVYGGSTPGTVDCSGLIYSYCGGARGGDPQLYTATESGYVSNGIPRVHGLGLHMTDHVGVYIGEGMAVDARNSRADMCYDTVDYMDWTQWFKLAAVDYIEEGWEYFNGNYYFYENGEYIVDTSRTIDGETYYFASDGIADHAPSDLSYSTSSGSSDSEDTSASESDTEEEETVEIPLYKNGSEGDEVKKIQERLAELGYYDGEITGNFDDATEAAYIAFQTQAGLMVDGISGSDRDVLYSEDAPTAPEEIEETTVAVDEFTYQLGDENDTVASIQQQLYCLGYFDYEVTGYYGDYTAEAVTSFQIANSLEATGIVNEATYTAIFDEKAIASIEKATVAPTQAATIPAQKIIEKIQNQTYAETAVEVVSKTNKVTKKALSNSASVLPRAISASTSRKLNVGVWFAVVTVILAVIGGIFLLRDRKTDKRRHAKPAKARAYVKTESGIRYW